MPSSAMATARGPRVLLRRIREIMEAAQDSQKRLDRIVETIAQNMTAEVCSIYLASRPKELELFATVGLNKEAVHKTRMRFGEGLVGTVAENAEPLALDDAPSHPRFAYRPETGEDPFHSFLGVPIRRGGRLLGVLVVQNQTRRHYDDEELEALQTVAMVLGEIISAGELFEDADVTDLRADLPVHLTGEGYAEGLAIGEVVLHQPRVEIRRLIADDAEAELGRLEKAIAELHQAIDRIISRYDSGLSALKKMTEAKSDGESSKTSEFRLEVSADVPRDVLETYRMFAHDRGWRNRLHEAVLTGLTAEAAVERVQGEMRAKLQKSRDLYMRERVNDLDDLSNRLLRHLMGRAEDQEMPDAAILVALNMGAAELFDYDTAKLQGLVLQEGSRLSHVAIVARALGIPLVGRAAGVVDGVDAGDLLALDGERGDVFIRPSNDLLSAIRQQIAERQQRRAQYRAIRSLPAQTKDGVRIALKMNAGLPLDLPQLEATGADGIGLFRTELQYMIHPRMPGLPTQIDFYRQVYEAAGDRPVVFRTLDLGGDKVLPYLAFEREENPAMGFRALRLALDRPALLRLQVRALLQAGAGRPLRLMFPMVSDVSEFLAAKAFVDLEADRQKKLGKPGPSSLEVGCMVEVPSLLFELEALLPKVDFLSVGTNDLMQFLYAADRGNPRLQRRYDELGLPALEVFGTLVEATNRHKVPLTVCGEMAGDPLGALALVAVGVRSLSMQPYRIGPVKTMIRELDLSVLEAVFAEAREGAIADPQNAGNLREALRAFATREAVPL